MSDTLKRVDRGPPCVFREPRCDTRDTRPGATLGYYRGLRRAVGGHVGFVGPSVNLLRAGVIRPRTIRSVSLRQRPDVDSMSVEYAPWTDHG